MRAQAALDTAWWGLRSVERGLPLQDLFAEASGLPVADATDTGCHPTEAFAVGADFGIRDSIGELLDLVAEAIEMGVTAMLVDEDVSAANFMARDGRMRALVADESITPLLYRVNGLYQHHGISSVVVEDKNLDANAVENSSNVNKYGAKMNEFGF